MQEKLNLCILSNVEQEGLSENCKFHDLRDLGSYPTGLNTNFN